MCTVQSKRLSLCLFPELCCINVIERALDCRTITMEFLLWMFFFFSFVFHKALLKTKCSKFIKRQNKTQKPSSLDVRCVSSVCVTSTCRSARRNGAQTLGGLGEACVSLIVSSWGDPVILVCEARKNILHCLEKCALELTGIFPTNSWKQMWSNDFPVSPNN